MGKNKLLAGLFAGVLASTAAAVLTISPTSAAGGGGGNDATFPLTDNTPITLPCGGTGACNAAPFPATINQYGMSTVITDVNVTLLNVSHTYPDDLDIKLTGPNGASVALMSDACGGDTASSDIANRNLTFDDQATGTLPDDESPTCNTTQSSKPINYSDAGPEQFGTAPSATTLAAFNGINPNGAWSLRVGDDANLDTGGIAGGWLLTINTASTAPITIPAFGTSGAGVAAPYPAPIPVSGRTGLITDVNVSFPFSHTFPGDLGVVLVSPAGKKVQLMAFSCGGTAVLEKTLTFDDSAATSVTTAPNCAAGGTFKPATNALPNLPGPAPAGPYATTMSAFNGDSPNGQWSMYINDGSGLDGGWISATPTLTIQTTDVIAPDTKLVGKKPENTTKTKVKIKFESTEAGSTFKCKVDGKKYKPCSSPLKLKNLKVGKHKVLIVATDAAGNSDPKALKIKWKIFADD